MLFVDLPIYILKIIIVSFVEIHLHLKNLICVICRSSIYILKIYIVLFVNHPSTSHHSQRGIVHRSSCHSHLSKWLYQPPCWPFASLPISLGITYSNFETTPPTNYWNAIIFLLWQQPPTHSSHSID